MRPYQILAAALFVAPLTSSATEMEPTETEPTELEPTELAGFIAAGEAAAERAPLMADPQARALDRFRGYQSWMDAYDLDGDPSRLCAARALLFGIVRDEEVDPQVRSDAAGLLADLEIMLPTPGCEATARVPLLGDTDSPEAERSGVSHVAKEVGPAIGVDSPPVAEGRKLGIAPAIGVDSPPVVAGRKLGIAGGVTLGVGVTLLGAMTYGLVVDSRAAEEIRGFTRQKEAGTLTIEDWTRSQTVVDRGRAGAQLATLAGISGGLSVVTGAVLLIVGRRRTRQQNNSLALTPSAGAGQAHITLRGRF